MRTHRAILIAAALTAVTTAAWAQMKPEDAIKARQSVMRVIALNVGPMGAMVKGDVAFDAGVFATNAARAASVSTMALEAYFQEGTTSDDSRAMEEIWFNRDDFESRLEDLRDNLARLSEIAAGGDEAAMKDQFGEVGKVCKGCHDEYREDE
jgi:cytochrome c556